LFFFDMAHPPSCFHQYSIFCRILQGGGLFFDYGGAEIKLWGALKRGDLMPETGSRFVTGSTHTSLN